MKIPPKNYAEWSFMLDQLQQQTDDEEVLRAMQQGELVWQSGVAERFSKRLVEVVNQRMDGASDSFGRKTAKAGGNERVLVQALLDLRKEMKFLAEVMSLSVIPQDLRTQYVQLVKDQADRMQNSLEDSAKKTDRSGKVSSIVRNHPVNR